MIRVKKDNNDKIYLVKESGEKLFVVWDFEHNYWFGTDGDEFSLTLDETGADRHLSFIFWRFIKSAIGSYYLFCDGSEYNTCPDFFKSEGMKKILTIHSDPIGYGAEKSEGATMIIEFETYKPTKIKLSGGKCIDGKRLLRIDPNVPNSPVYNDVVDLYSALNKKYETEKKWEEERQTREI
jgi:hypothetical protein